MISFQTNIDSLVAQQNLNTNSMFQSNTIQQLTSGYRINSSGDDAAGLAVANQDRDQVAQITQGVANGNNGTAQLQIMDGGMSNISQILDRLQSLSTESASSSFTGNRATLNAEFQTDIGELNRQAQAIGLNTGGTYATTLDVYLGGGAGSNAAAVSADGQVQVNLTSSAVDAQALGLSGLQVVAGTADISTNSTTHSVSNIVQNSANATATAGTTVFYLSGPGFSDSGKVAVSVNLAGVSDTNSLVTAINNAIKSASSGTPAGDALGNANITASVHTDASGGQELAFSSSTAAFQVQAGDQMANALMGNFLSGSEGALIQTKVTGGNTGATNTAFTPSAVTVSISGASMAGPVNITFGAGANTVGTAIQSLETQVQQSTALQAAGITVTGAPGSPLVFTSATGETFNVQAIGDTNNLLGLGALNTSAQDSSAAFYSTVEASAPSTGNGLATLGISLNGGAPGGGTAATIAGTAPASIAGTTTPTVNGSALGTLSLSVNSLTPNVSVNFANDANHLGTAAVYTGAAGSTLGVDTLALQAHAASVTSASPLGNATTVNTAALEVQPAVLTGSGVVGDTFTAPGAGGGITINGHAVTYTNNANPTTLENLALDINNTAALSGVVTANVVTNGVTGLKELQLTSGATGAAAQVDVKDTADAEAVGLTTAGAGDNIVNGAAAQGLTVSIDGTQKTIYWSAGGNTGAAETQAHLVSDINTKLNAAFGTVSDTYATLNGATGAITLASQTKGSDSSVILTNNAAAQAFGLTSASGAGTLSASGAAQTLSFSIDGKAAQTVDFTGDVDASAGENLNQVASYINGQLNNNGTYGASYANAVQVSGNSLVITSQGTGAVNGSVSVSATTGVAATTLGLTGPAVSGTNETLANVVSYINSQVNASMGWGNSVNVAAVTGTGVTSAITLTDPYANASSNLGVAAGATAYALGLTTSAIATASATGTGAAANSVTLNMAGGDATSAAFTSSTQAAANIAMGRDVALNFSIDGTTVNANFNNDVNSAGTAAILTGNTVSSAGVDTNALQAQGATVTGTNQAVNTAALEAQDAVVGGTGIATPAALALIGGAGNLTINGTAVTFTQLGAGGNAAGQETLAQAATDISNAAYGANLGVTASVQTNAQGDTYLQLTSNTAGASITVADAGGSDSAALGLTIATSSLDAAGNSNAAQGLSVTLGGGAVTGTHTITWTSADGNASSSENLTDVVTDLNTKLNTAFGTSASPLVYASINATTGAIQIANPDTGTATTIALTGAGALTALGVTTASATGTAATKLDLNIDGRGEVAVDFSNDTNANGTPGLTESLANVAAYINTQLSAAYGANYANAVTAANNTLTITSQLTGSLSGAVSVGSSTNLAATNLGLNIVAPSVTGKDETLANVVSFLNTTAQQALGAATTANIFSVSNGAVSIASQTKGDASSINLVSGTAGVLTGLGLTTVPGALGTTGTNASLASLVTSLNQDFTSNTTLQAAGLNATQNGTDLTIQSANQTNFRLGESDTTGTSLGFGSTTGGAPAPTAGLSHAHAIDAGGTSALGNGTTSPYMTFSTLAFGGDTQSVTIGASSATGAAQPPLTITLQNNATAQTGASIDSAVSYINSQLQQSENPTLQSIVAVKENVGGVEQINFLSNLPSFTVSVGSSANANGLNGGLAKTFDSIANGAAANASIDTLSGAQAAVTAVTTAVAQLGTAQAAVGIGENQVNYAVNLAQSQITNISSAESQIRDANVAQQAANMTKASVLEQATIAAMAQANQEPQAVLKLLQQ
jgi:flagellin